MSNEVIIVGAGSVGTPIAMSLAEQGVKTLVLDSYPSPGQGENKHAIGGVRATHSDPAKILTCRRSLEIFSSWEKKHGDDIEWLEGGYAFVVYREKEEQALKSILPIQKKFGLNIDFVDRERMLDVIPGLSNNDLIGGTYSPNDGSASPLLSTNAMYRKAVENGAEFRFNETVSKILTEDGKTTGVMTKQGNKYDAPIIIDAAGGHSKELCATVGVDIPVKPDSHEAGITEPVKSFCHTMVVDIRPAPGSKNFYFYQSRHGQLIFCITPDPPIYGTDKRETSAFLPKVAKRMVGLVPRLGHLRVRRVWRGLYPMTPDGSPIVGWNNEVKGLLHSSGQCGQGYMLGPGLGEVVARLVTDKTTEDDEVILKGFDPYRDFTGVELLK